MLNVNEHINVLQNGMNVDVVGESLYVESVYPQNPKENKEMIRPQTRNFHAVETSCP